MTTNLVPQKYQVIKLFNGQELVGMTRDRGNTIQITLPMLCHLTVALPEKGTVATFYPYSPMSSDPIFEIPKAIISHASSLNEQFIPLYDKASSQWLKMIESQTIPLVDKPAHELTQRMIEDEIERLMEKLDYANEYNEYQDQKKTNTAHDEFVKMSKPKDGKIH